jgi:cytochrome c-type biogenesis protein CcmF
LASIGIPFALGAWSPLVALGVGIAVWIGAAVVANMAERMRLTRSGLFAQPRSWLGMHVAHFGIAVFVAGVTLVTGFEAEKDVRMALGDTVSAGGYDFKLLGIRQVKGPNFSATVGDVQLSQGNKQLRILNPEKRQYLSSAMPMTEAAIDANVLRHLYVSLGEPLADGAWSVRVYYKPFVNWIWGGCVLMALGGFLAVSDRRYRLKVRERFRAPTVEGAAA